MREKVSILIVEGEKLDRELLTIILNMGPFIVNTIDSVEMALEQVETTTPPNLVITNAKLGNLSGSSLIQNIRNSKNWLDVPIIVIASEVSPSTVLALKKSGANAIISKPYDPLRLQTEVLTMTGYERVGS